MAFRNNLMTFPKWDFMTKLKVTLQGCVVLNLVLLSQLTFLEGAHLQKREAADNVTVPAVNWSSTQNTTTVEEPSDKDNTGTVVAVSIICLLLCITIVLSVYFFKRKRQSRMMDREKKMQIQMSSARNAGVYQDLTVSVPSDEKSPASPEHERLHASEDA